jgi:hypothetical protein
MSRYRHHKYTYTKFFSPRHSWELVGPKGGVHFHVTMVEGYGTSCGLEIHYYAAPDYMKDDAPSQMPCWLLHAPCWHNGTSLYAEETLWPMIKPLLANGDHEKIFQFLEQEADNRFSIRCEG